MTKVAVQATIRMTVEVEGAVNNDTVAALYVAVIERLPIGVELDDIEHYAEVTHVRTH